MRDYNKKQWQITVMKGYNQRLRRSENERKERIAPFDAKMLR